jgi:hypothetical protein
MADTRSPDINSTASWLKFWWPVIVMIVTVAISWGVLTQQIEDLRCDVDENRIAQRATDQTFTEIKVQLAQIQRDILYIRETMERESKK